MLWNKKSILEKKNFEIHSLSYHLAREWNVKTWTNQNKLHVAYCSQIRTKNPYFILYKTCDIVLFAAINFKC